LETRGDLVTKSATTGRVYGEWEGRLKKIKSRRPGREANLCPKARKNWEGKKLG